MPGLDDKVLGLIKTDIANELAEQGAGFDNKYLQSLEEFWNVLRSFFGADKEKAEEYRKKYPGLARFRNIEQFQDFYKGAVLSKIYALKGNPKFKNQLIHIKKKLTEAKTDYNFFIPFTEVEKRDKSNNINKGGIHTDVTFVMPDGQTVMSRHKHFAQQKDYELEKICLTALSTMGHRVPTPESVSQELLVLSTPMRKSDFRYILKAEEKGGKREYVHGEQERLKRAREAIDILIPAVMDLTLYKDGKLVAPKGAAENLDKLFKDEQYFEENAQRFGFDKYGILTRFIDQAAKSTGTKLDLSKDKHLEHLIEKYNKLVFSKINDFGKFIVHGDVFVGNMLEDFDGNMELMDFTPFQAPITWDLYSIIEFLGLSNESRENSLQYAAKKIVESGKRRGINGTNEEQYLNHLKHEYQWMSIHRNFWAAGKFLQLKRSEPETCMPDPSQYYSRALRIIDELGKNDPQFVELGAIIRSYTSQKFRKDGTELLKEVPVNDIDLSCLYENRQVSLTAEALEGLEDLLGRKPGTDRKPDTSKPCDPDAIIPSERVVEALKKAKQGVPAGMYDYPGWTNEVLIHKTIQDEGTIADIGKEYLLKMPLKMPDKNETFIMEEQTIPKLQGNLEYSIRGKELHVINHRENTRYKIDLTKEDIEHKPYEAKTGQFTDRRTVWDVKKELEEEHGKGKVIIETLEDRTMFKRKKMFGEQILDEILFDTAPLELQLLKHVNKEFAKGKQYVDQRAMTGDRTDHTHSKDRILELDFWPLDEKYETKFVYIDRKGKAISAHDIISANENAWCGNDGTKLVPIRLRTEKNARVMNTYSHGRKVEEIPHAVYLKSNEDWRIQNEKGQKRYKGSVAWVKVPKELTNTYDRLFERDSFPHELRDQPFALKAKDGRIVTYTARDGMSCLTSPEEEKQRTWNGVRGALNSATGYAGTFLGTVVAGIGAADQDPKYIGAGAGIALATNLAAWMVNKNGKK